MTKDKGRLLMIALGKGKKAPPPESDADGLGDGPEDGDEADSDEGDEPETDDEYSDDDSVQCAHDLMDALDKGDAEGVAEAIKAIAGK